MTIGLPRNSLGNPLALTAPTVESVSVAKTSRYDIQLVENNVSIPSLPFNATSMSPTIMFNGRAITYFSNSSGPTLYRYTFDYSEVGITNKLSTAVDSTTSITQLPPISSPDTSAQWNQEWSHVVSSTQILCKFNLSLPFLVTWDRGETNSSFVYPVATGAVTALMTNANAFLLPNGNLCVFGRDNSSTVYLCEYTPTLTHVRNLSLGSFSGLNGSIFYAGIKRTSYGYIVGLVHTVDGISAKCMTVTLNSTCTEVVSSRTNTMSPGSHTTSPVIWSTILGEDGAIFLTLMNGSQLGWLNVPVYSNGSIYSVVSTQYADNSQNGISSAALRSLVSQSPSRCGCTKYADALAPLLFATHSTAGNLGLVMMGKSFTGDSCMIGYVDMQLDPIINSNASAENSGIWSADVNRTVNAAYGMVIGNTITYGVNLHFDDNGLIYLGTNSSIAPAPRLLRRVDRIV